MTEHDVIVVGARCAGSPTAMLLARAGHRVLLVDRATFPSDALSTLIIHAPGVAALSRWGLLDRVAASGCPPIRSYEFDFGAVRLRGSPRPVDGVATGYAPRRTVLDKLLVDAARRSGVEVREHFNVDGLVVEDGVVVGVRGHGADGRSVTARARVVVGADGRHSRVAASVGAEEYNRKPRLQYGYYTFYRDLPVDGVRFVVRPYRALGLIPTNDGLTLLVFGWPVAEMRALKADVEAALEATLALAPEVARQVHGATRVAPFVGGGVWNYFRKPYGAGWALVGDAGYNKDPVTAQGISDAFRDAERCATALAAALDGRRDFDEAMAEYHGTRDRHTLPMYEFTAGMATLDPPPAELQQLLGAVAGDQRAMDDFASVIAGTLPPDVFFAPDNVARIVSGRPDIAAAS